MPHLIVKLHPGRDLETKKKLTQELVKSVVKIAGCSETAVSVGFEEISAENWAEEVYRPDILEKVDTLIKKPGYNPFESK